MSKKQIITPIIALIAEMDLVVKNLINIFYVSRNLGSEGIAAYELVMPCVMVVSAFVALGYNGIQAVCAKDYGSNDHEAFERHRNAGYTWLLAATAVLTLVFAIFKVPILDLLGANDGSNTLAILSRECYSMFLLCFVPQSIFSIACCLFFFEEKVQLLIINIILYTLMFAGCGFVTATGPSMTGYILVNLVSIMAADIYIVISCFIIRRKSSKAAFTAISLRISDIRESFFTGLPDFMEYAFVSVLYLVENLYILRRFSESVIAGLGVFEAIDNLPEIICVGFSFLVTACLGTCVGKHKAASSETSIRKAEEILDKEANKLTLGALTGAVVTAAFLIVTARPATALFLTDNDPAAAASAVLLTVSCALGFVFYLLNSELVCYYKIIGAYIQAHVLFLAEALLFPLGAKILLGEIFGVAGFCMGGAVGEFAAFILNLAIVWISSGKFPLKMSDFRMDRYLMRLRKKGGK